MKSLASAGIATLLLLSGCAPTHYTKTNVVEQSVCDVDLMARIERQASRSHLVQVVWVDCPRMTVRVN